MLRAAGGAGGPPGSWLLLHAPPVWPAWGRWWRRWGGPLGRGRPRAQVAVLRRLPAAAGWVGGVAAAALAGWGGVGWGAVTVLAMAGPAVAAAQVLPEALRLPHPHLAEPCSQQCWHQGRA